MGVSGGSDADVQDGDRELLRSRRGEFDAALRNEFGFA